MLILKDVTSFAETHFRVASQDETDSLIAPILQVSHSRALYGDFGMASSWV
jgi:hypothetical protein